MAPESKTKSLEIVQLLQNVCAKWVLLTESSNGAPTSHVDDPTNKFLGRSGKDYIQSNGINVAAIANSGGDQINDEYHSD